MIRRMIVFGVTGDLMPRYLLPALARLHEANRLPTGFEVSGLARDDWDIEAFRRFVEERLAKYAIHLIAARGCLKKVLLRRCFFVE